MVGSLVDHMVALVVTGVMFVSAVAAVPTLSYVNLFYVDQQQLRNIALDTLKTMLLDTGYPSNWGAEYTFDSDDVERFGLALAGSSSSYVLDPNKVQRLLVGNPAGFMEYEEIRAKLKLEGYGFTFKIIPPFKVIVNDRDFDGESNPITLENLVEGIDVLVVNNAGHPVPQALVRATLLYVLTSDGEGLYLYKVSNKTGALGRCLIAPDIPHDPNDVSDLVVVFKVTVADLTTFTSSYLAGFEPLRVINASIVGDNMTLTVPEGSGWEKGSAGARWVSSVVLVNEEEVWTMYNGTKSNADKITWGGGYWGWSMKFSGLSHYNALFGIFTLSVPSPRRTVFLLGPEAAANGLRAAVVGDPSGATPIVQIQRSVSISGMTYIAELDFWKESP